MEDIDDFLARLAAIMHDLPVVRSTRNIGLRENILRELAARLLTDDERAKFLGLPEGCRIREGAKILSPENLVIGRRCWIGENAVLDASGGLTIGADCSIGLSVFVWTHSSHLTNLTGANIVNSPLIQRRATTIGNGVFIAGPSVVLPGAVIGDNVLVRPFSTVSGEIPDGSLVDGLDVTRNVFDRARIERMVRRAHEQASGTTSERSSHDATEM